MTSSAVPSCVEMAPDVAPAMPSSSHLLLWSAPAVMVVLN